MCRAFFLFILLSILGTSMVYSQIPDYTNLSKKEKLRFINGYGFLELTTGDTIYVKIETLRDVNVPKIDKYGKIHLSYPKLLKKYAYKKTISLDSVSRFFYGRPRRFRNVIRRNNRSIDLETISLGKYNLYKRDFYILDAYDDSNYAGSKFVQMADGSSMRVSKRSRGPLVTEMLYIQKASDDSIYRLYGRAYTKTRILSELLKDDMTDKQLKKLKGRNDRIIEAIKNLNAEDAGNQ